MDFPRQRYEEDKRLSKKERPAYSLSTIDKTPSFLQRPFILTGYRVYWSVSDALKSFFMLHNETLNVHTHFWGFAFFCWIMYYHFTTYSFKTWSDAIFLFLFIGSAQISFIASAGYHLLNCHSANWHYHCSLIDYLGININITGSMLTSIYIGYYCDPGWQQLYVGFFILFSIGATLVSNLPVFLRPQYTKLRISAFVLQISSCLVPLTHWIHIRGGFGTPEVDYIFWNLMTFFALLALGFGFYLSRIPERWAPGKFDIYFSSHQWWHVLVVGACYYHYVKLSEYFVMKTNQC